MFLEHLCSLGLLQPDPTTDILRQFPLHVRQTLAGQLVNVLLDSNFGAKALTSLAHVRWAMEAVGASFTLPMESEEVMSAAIELYRRWLLDASKRPSPINAEPHFFIRQILCHYSLLFESRSASPEALDTQAALCKRVLNIYHALGRESAHSGCLDEESWEIFLKLLLGISDSLLSLPENEDNLTKRLCTHTLKVLFELWLYSSTSEADMWGSLINLVPRWVHHLPTIQQWLAVCKGLTEKAISLMYGPDEGQESVVIQLEGAKEIVAMEGLQDEHVFYAWHRMLHAIGDPNHIQNPHIYLAAFKGIDTLVDIFLQIGRKSGKFERKEIKPPEGDTILHIFGNWLFDACMQKRDGFEEGRAVAVKTLCSIFSGCKSSPFSQVYLSRFYACLSQVLRESSVVMIAGLTNAGILYPCELPGFHILTPAFVYALNKVLLRGYTCLFSDLILNMPVLKKASAESASASLVTRPLPLFLRLLKILTEYGLGYLIPISNCYGDTKFSRSVPRPSAITTAASPKDTWSTKLPEIKTFSHVADHLAVLLAESLVDEASGANVRPLLSLCYTFAREIHLKRPDFALHVINTIVQKITHSQWPTGHCVDAYRVLGFFSSFYHFLPDADETSNFVVSSLTGMYTDESLRLTPSDLEIHMIEALECITCWLMVGPPWIYQYHKTKAAIIDIIMSALPSRAKSVQGQTKNTLESVDSDLKTKDRKTKKIIPRKQPRPQPKPSLVPQPSNTKIRDFSPRLRETAIHTLVTLMNHVGNFPNPSGTTCLSTLVSEEDVLALLPQEISTQIDPAQFVRYFISGNTIYTVIDRPNNGDGYVTLIIRDKTGKYAWDLQSTYLSKEDEKLLEGSALVHQQETSLEPFRLPLPPKSETDLPNMAKFIESKNKKTQFVSAQIKQTEKEKKYLRKKNWGLATDIRCFPPSTAPSPYSEAERRMLLSQLGFLSSQQKANFHQIDQTPAFFRALKTLDRTPERECLSVGVLYLGKGQTKKKVWANTSDQIANASYEQFLKASGWNVDVATHPGWIGQLDRSGKIGSRTLYFADYHKEMIYLASTMMDTDVKTKKKLIKSSTNTALILWTEEDLDLVMWYDWVFSICHIVIAIRPLPSGLFYVCTLNKNADIIHVGPLQEESVVGLSELSVLVRETAFSAYKGLKRSLADYNHPFSVRAGTIADIGSKFAQSSLPLNQYFQNLFTCMPADKLFPYSPPPQPRTPPVGVIRGTKPRPRATMVEATEDYRLSTPRNLSQSSHPSPRPSTDSSDSEQGSRRTSEDQSTSPRTSSGQLPSIPRGSQSMPSMSAPFPSVCVSASLSAPGLGGALTTSVASIRSKLEDKPVLPTPSRQAPVPSAKPSEQVSYGGNLRPSSSLSTSFENIPESPTGGQSSFEQRRREMRDSNKKKGDKKDNSLKKEKKRLKQERLEKEKQALSQSEPGATSEPHRASPRDKKEKRALRKSGQEFNSLVSTTADGSADSVSSSRQDEENKKRDKKEKRASRKSLHELIHGITITGGEQTEQSRKKREEREEKERALRSLVHPPLGEPSRQAPDRPSA